MEERGYNGDPLGAQEEQHVIDVEPETIGNIYFMEDAEGENEQECSISDEWRGSKEVIYIMENFQPGAFRSEEETIPSVGDGVLRPETKSVNSANDENENAKFKSEVRSSNSIVSVLLNKVMLAESAMLEMKLHLSKKEADCINMENELALVKYLLIKYETENKELKADNERLKRLNEVADSSNSHQAVTNLAEVQALTNLSICQLNIPYREVLQDDGASSVRRISYIDEIPTERQIPHATELSELSEARVTRPGCNAIAASTMNLKEQSRELMDDSSPSAHDHLLQSEVLTISDEETDHCDTDSEGISPFEEQLPENNVSILQSLLTKEIPIEPMVQLNNMNPSISHINLDDRMTEVNKKSRSKTCSLTVGKHRKSGAQLLPNKTRRQELQIKFEWFKNDMLAMAETEKCTAELLDLLRVERNIGKSSGRHSKSRKSTPKLEKKYTKMKHELLRKLGVTEKGLIRLALDRLNLPVKRKLELIQSLATLEDQSKQFQAEYVRNIKRLEKNLPEKLDSEEPNVDCRHENNSISLHPVKQSTITKAEYMRNLRERRRGLQTAFVSVMDRESSDSSVSKQVKTKAEYMSELRRLRKESPGELGLPSKNQSDNGLCKKSGRVTNASDPFVRGSLRNDEIVSEKFRKRKRELTLSSDTSEMELLKTEVEAGMASENIVTIVASTPVRITQKTKAACLKEIQERGSLAKDPLKVTCKLTNYKS